jgi:hypothetical protein
MGTEALSRAALTDMLGASLTEDRARAIFCEGEKAVVFALLTLAGELAATQSAMPAPTTRSGMIPAYQKPPAKKSPQTAQCAERASGSARRSIKLVRDFPFVAR